MQASIASQLKSVESWSSEVSFADLPRAKLLSEILIDLQFRQSAKKLDMGPIDRRSIEMLDLLRTREHLIILGDPGAGKTTTVRRLCQILLHEAPIDTEDDYSFPLVIRLRELLAGESMLNRLAEMLGIKAAVMNGELESNIASERYKYMIYKVVVPTILDELRVILFLDGFDELNPNAMEAFIQDFRELVLSTNACRILLTCRSGEFKYHIDNCQLLEILPLTPEQVLLFARRWLPDPAKYSDFLERLRRTPYSDAAVRPLILAHLCSIYEKYGTIPDKPKTVYKKIINLYLEEWDAQRSVRRQSNYASFEPDRKAEFLGALALELASKCGGSIFSSDQFLSACKTVCEPFALPTDEIEDIVAEIESHTGLVVQAGYQRFEFAHKSLQEYLCAEHITRLPSVPKPNLLIQNMPNELAIAVCLSSNPSQYLATVILDHLPGIPRVEDQVDFVSKFIHRLMVERPDFSINPLLGVAFFFMAAHLYQSALDMSPDASGHRALENQDRLLLEFSRLPSVEGSKKLALQYYKIEESSKTVMLTRKLAVPYDISPTHTNNLTFDKVLM